jgi:hypothetical protein
VDDEMKERLIMKRFLLGVLAVLPWMAACVAGGTNDERNLVQRSDVMNKTIYGAELIVNAVPGVEIFGVEMFADGSAHPFYASAVTRTGKSRLGLPITQLPHKVRVIWRKTDEVRMASGKIIYGGPLAGDHTIEVLSRIPDAVFEDLRKGKGHLRLKFRLKPDGVMLGWDVERRPGYKPDDGLYYPPAYSSVGGDFKEARPVSYAWDGQQLVRLPDSIALPPSLQDRQLLERYHLKTVGEGGILTDPPTPSNHRLLWEKGWYVNGAGERIYVDGDY